MNITYKNSDINKKDLSNMLKLWNDELGLVFPIPEKAFEQNVVRYEPKNILVAYDENKLVGFIVLKEFDNPFVPNYKGDLFISLFYVSHKYRNKGIGSKLFDFAEEIGKTKNKEKIVVGKDMNNFFPGVPNEFDSLTDKWLYNKGFEGINYTHDLICRNPITFPIKNKDIRYVEVDESRKEDLFKFLEHNEWGRWIVEARDYFKNGEEEGWHGYLVGINKDDEIVSFMKVNSYKTKDVPYNVMWQDRFEKLGGVGPLGVGKEFRMHGYAGDMLSTSINYLVSHGHTNLMIDWTSLMEIYRKYNFEVWKCYKYMYKTIR